MKTRNRAGIFLGAALVTGFVAGCNGSDSGPTVPAPTPTAMAGPTPTGSPAATPTQPASREGRIVFESLRDTGGIYAVNPDGRGLARILIDGSEPSVSVDGRRIVFSSAQGTGNTDIYTANIDGSNLRRLTTNSAVDDEPVLSSDGTRIVFVSTRNGDAGSVGSREIYIMNADGSGQTRLTNNTADDLNPSFSPDGRRIVFRSDRNTSRLNPNAPNPEIYVMNSDGSNQNRVTSNEAADITPTWQPGGAKIAFASDRAGNMEIYTMNPDGSSVTRLTNNTATDVAPKYSPDGKRIAFQTDRDGNQEVYVMNFNGTEQTNISRNRALDRNPSWGR